MKTFIPGIVATGTALVLNAVAADSSANALARWQVPTNWVAITPGPAMIAAFSPKAGSGKTIVVTVNCLRPDIAIHRERPPLLLPSFEMTLDSRKIIRSAVALPNANDRATMLETEGMDSITFVPRRSIVIKVLRSEEQWLYRLIGDAKPVASQKDAFIKFVQSADYTNP
jgi:hypothetical protein